MRSSILFLVMIVFSNGVANGQSNYRITSNSAGGIKLRMTVQQARKSMKGCRFSRSSDGEGVALIAVNCRGRRTMSLYAGEDDADSKIDWKRRIEFIEVWDKRFKTIDGVHPEMLLRDAEKKLGKIRQIIITQIESREFVTFRKERKGISYRTYGGIYDRPNYSTTRLEPGSRILSIQVRN